MDAPPQGDSRKCLITDEEFGSAAPFAGFDTLSAHRAELDQLPSEAAVVPWPPVGFNDRPEGRENDANWSPADSDYNGLNSPRRRIVSACPEIQKSGT